MAHTTDTPSATIVIPFTRYTKNPDGSLFVEGVATNDALDLDDQIIDRDFARKGLQTWFTDWANVRQMHATSLPPAGKAVELRELDNGDYWVRAHIVEPTAVKLVENEVYKAYSVGIAKPRIIRDSIAKNGRVVDGVFSEISLVDFPANPTCKFMLAKRAADADVEVVEKVTPAMLAKIRTGRSDDLTKAAQAAATWYALAKRNFDAGVGGGVDRDQIPGEDFAGPDRTYPIVTPGDVSDAASLIGKADDPDAVKSKIIAIAHRKGPKFVAELPDKWTNGKAASTGAELTKAGGGSMNDGDDGDDDGMKDCPTCKGSGKILEGHRKCPDCHGTGRVSKAVASALKKAKKAQKARREFQAGEKKPFPGAAKPFTKPGDQDGDGDTHNEEEDDDAAKVAKRKDAERGLEKHPEPDGDEDGPDVDDDGDGDKPLAKTLVPYHLQRLHDATCCAFREEDVLVRHPLVVKGIGALVDPELFKTAISDALADDAGTGRRAGDLPGLSLGFGLAVQVKAADAEQLEAGMGDLRKAFAEFYPDAHPTPTDIQPGQFKRPYIGAGHAPLSGGSKARIPLASHTPDPSQFQRGNLTDGREAAPKAGKAKLTKKQRRVEREQAVEVLKAMHDYIATGSPGVCPMDPFTGGPADPVGDQGSSFVGALASSTSMDMRAGARPTAANPGKAHQSTAITSAAVPDLVKIKADGSIEFNGPIEGKPLIDQDTLQRVITDAVTKSTATLTGEVETLRKRLKEMEAQPDPATAAVRGPAALAAIAKAQTTAGSGDDRDDSDAVDELIRLTKSARHPDSTVAGPAYAKLLTKIGPEKAADLIAP